jgi:hypothetical protein
MERDSNKLIKAREAALNSVVGGVIACPSCGTRHAKSSYQSVFCKSKGGTKCKDNYWNNVDGEKRDNKTRISPAREKWNKRVKTENSLRKVKKMLGVLK